MAVETFIVDTVEWLKNVSFDEMVYGQPGKIVLYCILGVIWLYIALMVYKDAEHRYLERSKAKYCWLGIVLLTGPIGWLVYLALRPAVDLDESYLQKVEERYLSFESRGLGYCAKCGMTVDPDFLFCTGCGARVRSRCKKCDRIVEKIFEFCPACGEKMEGTAKVAVLSVNDVEKAERIKERKLARAKKEMAESVAVEKTKRSDMMVPFHKFVGNRIKSGIERVSGGIKRFFGNLKKPKKIEKTKDKEEKKAKVTGAELSVKSTNVAEEQGKAEGQVDESDAWVPETKKSKKKNRRNRRNKKKNEITQTAPLSAQP